MVKHPAVVTNMGICKQVIEMSIQDTITVLARIRDNYIERSGDCSLYVRTSIVEFSNVLIHRLQLKKLDRLDAYIDDFAAKSPVAMRILLRDLCAGIGCAEGQSLEEFLLGSVTTEENQLT